MIKIQNIYYMLAYAFQVLNEEGYRKVVGEKFENAEDLLAAILAKGLSSQIKRGLGQDYIETTGVLSSPRGKINISSSIIVPHLSKRWLVCDYDEFTENSYMNQILKATALTLICSSDVEPAQKSSLKKTMLYFHDVDTINPGNIRWASLRFHSNNATYRMLINICRFVLESLLLTEEDGTRHLPQFSDSQMPRLFEKFVLEYYRKHYPHYKVSAAQIDWITDDGITAMLPIMKSDITLEYNGKVMIIDTKYYSRVMQGRDIYSKQSLHSGNLYQIYAYVKNRDANNSGDVSGLLLYAKTDEEISPDNQYCMSGNRVSVKTLRLDEDFRDISRQLDGIAQEWESL
ncbi:MAG: 5-methylcytosine-specific restriction endonuclease system specificity protein McrC [Defluviitaleaceae bacterium]|nr:5-methylcytosine-specific restriction endonuclease system specificity protein McrC [Defluviitaleaceae bacterium]MCL2238690.1 5-methylcytosine-specific restriction endonuclease system specificity protein McrC [Defluviitaleaceae bacterium]